jgi:hypothetical protein
MKHTTASRSSTNNPATLLQSSTIAGQHDALFRSIFDGVTRTPRSNSAFQAVADGLSTYGRATHTNWDFDADVAKQQGNKAARPVCKAERKDKRQNGSWVRDFIPATLRSDYPDARNERNTGTVSQGCSATKRYRVEKLDKATGETVGIVCRLITNTVVILTYGKIVEFSMTNRASGTFMDGRDGKRKPLCFAKSELQRMVGVTEGNKRYAELTQFPATKSRTESPCDPATQAQGHAMTGHAVAGQQASM